MSHANDDAWRRQDDALKRVFQELYMGRMTEEQAAKRIQHVCSTEFLSAYIANAFSRGWITRFNVGLSEDGKIL